MRPTGDLRFSFWSYHATHLAGGRLVVFEGVDVWTFSRGKVSVKDVSGRAFLFWIVLVVTTEPVQW